MGLNRKQLDALLPKWMDSAEARSRSQDSFIDNQADRDSRLAQLIRGKEMDHDSEDAMLSRQITETERMRGVHGPDVSVSVKGVNIGATDPLAGLKALVTKRDLNKPQLTPGQEAADKDFGKDYSNYQAQGGYSKTKKNLQTVDEAIQDLDKQDGWDEATGHLPDWARAIVGPTGLAREQNLKGAVQGTLRETLGAQFTDKEGKRVEDRSMDSRMSKKVNIERAKKIRDELDTMARAKDAAGRHFETHGTLVGHGAVPGGSPQGPPPAQPPVDFSKMSLEQMQQMLKQLKEQQ